MISLQAEELTDAAFIQLGADDAQAAHDVGSAVADIQLAGDEVEVDPLTVGTGHDALGTQNDAVLAGVQLLQNGADLLSGVLLCSLAAPGGEDLVGVVVMMVMVMVMAAAGAVLAMLVVVMMLMVMVVTAAALLAMLVVVVMLMVVVVTAAALLAMLVMVVMLMVMVMMLMAALGRLMAVVMLVAALVVMVMTAAALLAMLVMMVMLMLGGLHVLFQGVLALEGGDELLAA